MGDGTVAEGGWGWGWGWGGGIIVNIITCRRHPVVFQRDKQWVQGVTKWEDAMRSLISRWL